MKIDVESEKNRSVYLYVSFPNAEATKARYNCRLPSSSSSASTASSSPFVALNQKTEMVLWGTELGCCYPFPSLITAVFPLNNCIIGFYDSNARICVFYVLMQGGSSSLSSSSICFRSLFCWIWDLKEIAAVETTEVLKVKQDFQGTSLRDFLSSYSYWLFLSHRTRSPREFDRCGWLQKQSPSLSWITETYHRYRQLINLSLYCTSEYKELLSGRMLWLTWHWNLPNSWWDSIRILFNSVGLQTSVCCDDLAEWSLSSSSLQREEEPLSKLWISCCCAVSVEFTVMNEMNCTYWYLTCCIICSRVSWMFLLCLALIQPSEQLTIGRNLIRANWHPFFVAKSCIRFFSLWFGTDGSAYSCNFLAHFRVLAGQ